MMQGKRRFQNHHWHIVPDIYSLLEIMLPDKFNFSGISFYEIDHLLRLLSRRNLLLENYPGTVTSFIQYVSDTFTDRACDLIDEMLTLTRVSTGFMYDDALQDATKIFSFHRSEFGEGNLALSDCIDLSCASVMGADVLLSVHSEELRKLADISFVRDSLSHMPKIFNTSELANFISENSVFGQISDDDDESVKVFTPTDDVVYLPKDSTPVDFAYKIHTLIGHSCRRCLVNGESKSLDYKLKNGDCVEIISGVGDDIFPKIEWQKFVVTDKANLSIDRYYRKVFVKKGTEILIKEFGSPFLEGSKFRFIILELGLKSPSEFKYLLGTSKISIDQVKDIAHQYVKNVCKIRDRDDCYDIYHAPVSGIKEKDLFIAECCRPTPSDSPEIVALCGQKKTFIHDCKCRNIWHLKSEKKKLVEWNCMKCTASIQIRVVDRNRMLSCIINKFDDLEMDVNYRSLTPASFLYPSSEKTSIINCLVLFKSRSELDLLSHSLESLVDVIKVRIKRIYPGTNTFNLLD